jgi:hypothetical protein
LGPGSRQAAPGPAARGLGKPGRDFWYDLANVAGRWFLAVCGVFVLAGCGTDAGEICDRLDECHLLPSASFSTDKCEDQVEQKVGKKRREQCAECVSEHECAQIQDACRAVCAPERQ